MKKNDIYRRDQLFSRQMNDNELQVTRPKQSITSFLALIIKKKIEQQPEKQIVKKKI